MSSPEDQERKWGAMRSSMMGGGVGWSMAADIVTGTFLFGGLGWLVDRWLGTDPWVMVSGFVIGHGMGIYAAMLHMKRMQRDALPRGWTPRPPEVDERSEW